ncbi:hypothetical protein TRFO_20636 [Tritrichomonas foetus]|uniref:Serpin domain-containing protein n=1 Tax=Tritrichomonas foetus TaxID=1144522 RepID=A0A1J4KGJ0_9EUKA|nr:hypothetical protein TRFO_20636 [Tritrichomonas foetus]|eukprot:OHT10170.1 hypothetical protein TRFO_20636 [Tritrichomonas foetus]
MNQFLEGISNSLADFSLATAAEFFKETSRNAVFSPYSLFIALFLTSAVNPPVSQQILKRLSFPNTEISQIDQIMQLKYLVKNIETVPPFKRPFNSPSFENFINNYNFTDDQKHIAYVILKKMTNKEKTDLPNEREKKFEYFLEKVTNGFDGNESSSLSKRVKSYKHLIKKDLVKYPVIAGSNFLFINSKTNFSLSDRVLKRMRDFIFETEFPSPGYELINEKVNLCTRGLIPNFLTPSDLSQSSLFLAVNTIYFKAKWENKFSRTNQQIPFYSFNDKETPTDFIKSTVSTKVYDRDGIVYIKLNYFRTQFVFEILMPKTIDHKKVDSELFNEFKQKAYHENFFIKYEKRARESTVFLMMPKFTIKTELMNFDKAINIPLLDSIVQKVVMIVNEEGTEAAAASGVQIKSARLDDPKVIKIDHPFIFVIRDPATQGILFMGEFYAPEETK